MAAVLTGVVPVVPTIFHDDQSVDLGGTARVVDYLMDAADATQTSCVQDLGPAGRGQGPWCELDGGPTLRRTGVDCTGRWR